MPVVRRKLSKGIIDSNDAMRRYTRRGVARAVMEQYSKPKEQADSYYENHPIADELRHSMKPSKIERLARENNPVAATHASIFGMEIDESNPKSARWP